MKTASLSGLILALCLAVPAAGQDRTIFNTPDFRQDRALWTSPAYYLNNTAGQLSGMALDVDTYEGATGQPAGARHWGTPGTARVGAVNYASPYRFTSAKEHYETWLKEANGGTKHTRATIPDWSGHWQGGGANADYQAAYVQEMKANSEGRMWWAGAYCLPGGFFSALGAQEFLVTPERVWTLSGGNGSNGIRWIYTDGSGHTPEELRFPKWHGESVGFWNGDALIVYTNQIRPWKGGVSEHSEQLETVERYRRVGDRIEGEITIYDPVVLVRPLTAKMNFTLNRESNPALRPLFATCTDTNGPSPKVHMDDKGLLNEYLSGEGGYQWDVADQRPWVTWFDESDRRYRAYLAAGGKPHGVD
jgi:hypothetical protein